MELVTKWGGEKDGCVERKFQHVSLGFKAATAASTQIFKIETFCFVIPLATLNLFLNNCKVVDFELHSMVLWIFFLTP